MGARFWLVLLAAFIAGPIVAGIVFLVIGAAVVSWGFLGTLFVCILVVLAVGWLIDRRRSPRLDRV